MLASCWLQVGIIPLKTSQDASKSAPRVPKSIQDVSEGLQEAQHRPYLAQHKPCIPQFRPYVPQFAVCKACLNLRPAPPRRRPPPPCGLVRRQIAGQGVLIHVLMLRQCLYLALKCAARVAVSCERLVCLYMGSKTAYVPQHRPYVAQHRPRVPQHMSYVPQLEPKVPPCVPYVPQLRPSAPGKSTKNIEKTMKFSMSATCCPVRPRRLPDSFKSTQDASRMAPRAPKTHPEWLQEHRMAPRAPMTPLRRLHERLLSPQWFKKAPGHVQDDSNMPKRLPKSLLDIWTGLQEASESTQNTPKSQPGGPQRPPSALGGSLQHTVRP